MRELENVVERALIFAGDRLVDLADLSIVAQEQDRSGPFSEDLRSAVREFEREHIGKVLKAHDYSKVAAAETLGIGLSSLYRKMEELEISKTASHV